MKPAESNVLGKEKIDEIFVKFRISLKFGLCSRGWGAEKLILADETLNLVDGFAAILLGHCDETTTSTWQSNT